MTRSYYHSPDPAEKSFIGLWFDRWFQNRLIAQIVAFIALVNLGLVAFDLSYVPLRDFWLTGKVRVGKLKIGPIESEGINVPLLPPAVSKFITTYDAIKAIEPYRDTSVYLQQVDQLKQKVDTLDSPEVMALLEELQERSIDMIVSNPFQIANKTGTLEKIKNKMREHIPNKEESSKMAFQTFWSSEHLKGRVFEELKYFEEEIQPLIASNYYRPIGETGGFVNRFGFIDFPFFVVFLVDFLGRTLYISRRYTGVNWFDAMLWRWYDIFLLLPLFRWLRIIPVTIRLNESRLINLKAIKKQASQGFVAGIAEDLTEVVVVRLINQLQESVKEGDMAKLLSQRSSQQYIDINDTNETAEIVKLVLQLVVNQVLPKIKPEVQDLLKYNVDKLLSQSPAYQGLQKLPGVERVQTTVTEQIIGQIYQIVLSTLSNLIEEDQEFEQLLERLVASFSDTLGSEIQAKQRIEEIESLLNDLLEEIKINYVQRLSEEDVEDLLEQTRALRQLSQSKSSA